MPVPFVRLLALAAVSACALALGIGSGQRPVSAEAGDAPTDCAPGNGGLTLPPGFCATVFADNLCHARHLAVANDGTIYVNTWHSPDYFPNNSAPGGGFVVALKDRDGDGVSDVTERFGSRVRKGGQGGTGIALWQGAIYAEEGGTVVGYKLTPWQLSPSVGPELLLSGLVMGGDHPTPPFGIDPAGSLMVNSGSASNTCESPNRQPGAKGADPCIEQQPTAAFEPTAPTSSARRSRPPIAGPRASRDTGGMALDASGRQHGRDQLWQNWPALYSGEQDAELPAETLFSPFKAYDFGWPTCYYDPNQSRRVLAPEYGGDGGKMRGRCAGKTPPIATFPAHWAPNDVVIHSGSGFPSAYTGGAFLAFHGSWNRAPAPQDGYLVAFQPLS